MVGGEGAQEEVEGGEEGSAGNGRFDDDCIFLLSLYVVRSMRHIISNYHHQHHHYSCIPYFLYTHL